jgi:hypothetical protein
VACPQAITIRSSLTGTADLFSTSYISGRAVDPDFVNVDLGAYPQLQEITGEVTFTFCLYAAANTSNMAIDNITFSGIPEPTGLMLGGLGAACLLIRRRRACASGRHAV